MNQEIALTAPATTARQERTSTTLPAQRVSTAAQTAIINIDNVVKTYESGSQQVRALKGVSLSVERGEMVAIMGPSGCGKTTLLNCASGLDVVDGGRITIAGADLAELSDKTRTTFRARNMGFVFQTYNLLPVLSAVENVELPLIVSGVNPREARQRALQALETVSLRQLANNRPAQLSGGQRQRVTIARSLVNEPDIVWADEPTGALDSKTADDIMQLMETLNREKGLTFVIVTHDPAIGARCNRVVRMRDGVIVSEESHK
ncbi:MAG: ABC transporter ATP-binding protein [Dehalococcoidia bacterium]|jgi:putative ABC transport system ATP-binding protein